MSTIYAVVWRFRHGDDTATVCRTEEQANAVLLNDVSSWWDEDTRGERGAMPEDPIEAVAAYCEFTGHGVDIVEGVLLDSPS